MFFARENEIKEMTETLRQKGRAVLLYGKRRVGKTELILKVASAFDFIYYECSKNTLEANVQAFAQECVRSGVGIPSYVRFQTFKEVFDYLNSLGRHYLIAIDEYPYLKELNPAPTVDSEFQVIIDRSISNLSLVLSGSALGTMKELLKEGNPLYGRFALTIHLKEFDYREAALFYPGLSSYEKAAFYAVYGGSPFVNRQIDPSLSLKENLVRTLLKDGNEAFNYANNILLSDVANELQARRILSAIGNGKKRYSELRDRLDPNKTGIINRALASLLESHVLVKSAPINRLEDDKKARYEIADNPLRFFYAYVYPNKSQLALLGPSAFYDEYVAPSIKDFVSRRYEEMVRQYFTLRVRSGALSGVTNIGMYYYDDPERHENGEFDVVLETREGYRFYEVKYLQAPLKKADMEKEARSIRSVKGLPIERIGFVSANGFEEPSPEYELYTGEDLYADLA